MEPAEYSDPRLVEVYDAECRWAPDDDFFLDAVNHRPASAVLDLGCGTGRLTVALAAAGHQVIGIDPARASLDAARARPGGDRVRWVLGTSSAAPTGWADTALLTSHVAQLLVDDSDWAATLDDLRRVLVPGGRLVFDSRDPADRGWQRWNPPASGRTIVLADGSIVQACTEAGAELDGVVDTVRHYRFPDGTVLSSAASLRFRTEAALRADLDAAGFTVEAVIGGWHGQPVGAGDGELIVTARRR